MVGGTLHCGGGTGVYIRSCRGGGSGRKSRAREGPRRCV